MDKARSRYTQYRPYEVRYWQVEKNIKSGMVAIKNNISNESADPETPRSAVSR